MKLFSDLGGIWFFDGMGCTFGRRECREEESVERVGE